MLRCCMSHRFSRPAASATPVQLDGFISQLKTCFTNFLIDKIINSVIVQLFNFAAEVADEILRVRVVAVALHAGDVGVQTFDAVSNARTR